MSSINNVTGTLLTILVTYIAAIVVKRIDLTSFLLI